MYSTQTGTRQAETSGPDRLRLPASQYFAIDEAFLAGPKAK